MAYIMIRLMKWLSYLVDISKRKKKTGGMLIYAIIYLKTIYILIYYLYNL